MNEVTASYLELSYGRVAIAAGQGPVEVGRVSGNAIISVRKQGISNWAFSGEDAFDAAARQAQRAGGTPAEIGMAAGLVLFEDELWWDLDFEGAPRLVRFAHMTRNLKGQGLDEGASTRLLVHAGKLIASGVEPVVACRASVAQALTDDRDMLVAVNELSSSLF